jgi:hypothetical protein
MAVVAVAVAATLVLATACSGKPAITKVTYPPAGHASPGAAVMGFFQFFVTGNNNACTYVIPGDAIQCLLALKSAKATVSGIGVGKTTIRGDEALVTVVGTFCVTQSKTKTCRSNQDPNVGQPKGGGKSAFDDLYQPAVQGKAINTSAVPCQKIAGLWYISLLSS